MNKNLFFYNMCNNYISPRMVKKIVSSNIDIDKICNLTVDEFSQKYGVYKIRIYDNILSFYNKGIDFSDISVYALYDGGLSLQIIDNLISFGIKTISQLVVFPDKYLSLYYGIVDSTIVKIREAIKRIDFDIIPSKTVVEKCMEKIVESKDFINSLVESFYDCFEFNDTIMLEDIPNYFPENYKRFGLIDYIFLLIKDNDDFLITSDSIKKKQRNLETFLKNLPDSKSKQYMIRFLNGENSSALANSEGITRSRVGQVLSKITFPPLSEDYLIRINERYNFSSTDFVKVFNISWMVYRYVSYRTKKKGSLNPMMLLEDDTIIIDSDVRSRIKSLDEKNIYVDDDKISVDKTTLFNYFFKKNANLNYDLKEIHYAFSNFYFEKTGKTFESDCKSFSNFLFRSNVYSVLDKNGKWRYYDFSKTDFFLDKFDFSNYCDIEISSLLIFNDYKEIMNEFDIRDYYELHCILKKLHPTNMELGRIPTIGIGKYDRKQQVQRLLMELSPVSSIDLANEYKRRYGIDTGTISTYIFNNFNDYYKDGIYDLKTYCMSDNDIDKWKYILKDDFYFFDDLKKIALNNGLEYREDFINRYNISRMGYIINSRYIFSEKLETISNYFNKLLSKDYINLDEIDGRIVNLVIFSNCLINKVKSLDLIEYEDRKYINYNVLKSKGIEKKQLYSFVNCVESYVDDYYCFTIKKLLLRGFNHELLSTELGNVFFASLLRSSDCFSYRRVNCKALFIFRKYDVSFNFMTSSVIDEIVSKETCSVNDLQRILNEEYDLDLSLENIKKHVFKSNKCYLNNNIVKIREEII